MTNLDLNCVWATVCESEMDSKENMKPLLNVNSRAQIFTYLSGILRGHAALRHQLHGLSAQAHSTACSNGNGYNGERVFVHPFRPIGREFVTSHLLEKWMDRMCAAVHILYIHFSRMCVATQSCAKVLRI